MLDYRDSEITFTKEELEQIAQIKRFTEWLQADSDLRNGLYNDKPLTTGQINRMKKIGIHLNLSDIEFIWIYPLATSEYISNFIKDNEELIDEELQNIVSRYPLLKLWGRYMKISDKSLDITQKRLASESTNERFEAWRNRRILATKSELGFMSMRLSHPSFTFELNEGCSVGCWFCSFAPDKLTGTLDYPKNRDEVLSIIRKCGEIFGGDMIKLSLPYYRTEPHDNPHYIDFLKDFENETGAVICTATAVCNDKKWIKKLIDYYQNREVGSKLRWPRLSILSLGILKYVHLSFSPMEIIDVELLIQVKDHPRDKVTGGRILKDNAGLRDSDELLQVQNPFDMPIIPQGSIACVSGFIINLVSQTIKIISPCYVSEKWPHGFRVFGQTTYKDASDFGDAIEALTVRYMHLSPPEDKIVKFRDDIVFNSTDDGFILITACQRHRFKGRNINGPLGELINSGKFTYDELINELTGKYNVNGFIVSAVIQNLFEDGLMDEVYD